MAESSAGTGPKPAVARPSLLEARVSIPVLAEAAGLGVCVNIFMCKPQIRMTDQQRKHSGTRMDQAQANGPLSE